MEFKAYSWWIHLTEDTSHFQVNITRSTVTPRPHVSHSSLMAPVQIQACLQPSASRDGEIVIYEWVFRLDDSNSVFQAKLFATLTANLQHVKF